MTTEVRIPLTEFAADPIGALERVIERHETTIVERDGVPVARVSPVRGTTERRSRGSSRGSSRGRAALRAAFGGWSDVDTDRLLAEVYADRKADDRPAVAL